MQMYLPECIEKEKKKEGKKKAKKKKEEDLLWRAPGLC
jgi:hypothetical protein